MRNSHAANPFHKIRKWTGQYFRAAELWEVGNYILVPHRNGERRCNVLRCKIDELEKIQCANDLAEQQSLNLSAPAPNAEDVRMYDIEERPEEAAFDVEAEERQNDAIDAFIQRLHENPDEGPAADGNLADIDPDDETQAGHVEDDVELPAYLRSNADGPGYIPNTDPLQNPYVRVVHTNGLHHLALVSCACHEDTEGLVLDLMASRLIPASFQRIRTIFTGQMLDYFRLCNLELKASAYQFYQLLRRLTLPTAPHQVVNLYNELRRMSRLWRWMKRLKWNGFGHSGRDPMDVTPGELAVYCPACPQPGINLPERWKEDTNKFVYRRMFVTDGNFKADHVKQPNNKVDHWLSAGGGMDPDHEGYMEFLKSAHERPTVSRRPYFEKMAAHLIYFKESAL